MEPPRVKPKDLDDYLEQLSKGVFQAGISWQVVAGKWDGIRGAFHDFNVERVARMTDREIDKLMQDVRVIRSRPKLQAIVANAHAMLELDRQHGSFRKYLRSFPGFEALSADLKKRFKFVGDSGAYHFLWTVSEPVPDWRDWAKAHGVAWGGMGAKGDGKKPGRASRARRPRS